MSVRELRHDRPMQVGGFQNPGFVCKRFLPFFPTPSRSFTYAIFRAVFDSRSSFFAPKPHGNACYVGEIFAQKGAGSDFSPVGRSGNGKIQIYVSFLMSDSYLSNEKLNAIDFFANLI